MPAPRESVTIVTTPAQKVAPINVKPGAAPGSSTPVGSSGSRSINKPETVSITETEAERAPSIDVRPTDQPGQAAARASGSAIGPDNLPVNRSDVEITNSNAVETSATATSQPSPYNLPFSSRLSGFFKDIGTDFSIAFISGREKTASDFVNPLRNFQTTNLNIKAAESTFSDDRQFSSGTIIQSTLPFAVNLGTDFTPDYSKLTPAQLNFAEDIKAGYSPSVAGLPTNVKIQSAFEDYVKANPGNNQSIDYQSGFQRLGIEQDILNRESTKSPSFIVRNTAQTAFNFAETGAIIAITTTNLELLLPLSGIAIGSSEKNFATAFFNPDISFSQRELEFGVGTIKVGASLFGIRGGASYLARQVDIAAIEGANAMPLRYSEVQISEEGTLPASFTLGTKALGRVQIEYSARNVQVFNREFSNGVNVVEFKGAGQAFLKPFQTFDTLELGPEKGRFVTGLSQFKIEGNGIIIQGSSALQDTSAFFGTGRSINLGSSTFTIREGSTIDENLIKRGFDVNNIGKVSQGNYGSIARRVRSVSIQDLNGNQATASFDENIKLFNVATLRFNNLPNSLEGDLVSYGQVRVIGRNDFFRNIDFAPGNNANPELSELTLGNLDQAAGIKSLSSFSFKNIAQDISSNVVIETTPAKVAPGITRAVTIETATNAPSIYSGTGQYELTAGGQEVLKTPQQGYNQRSLPILRVDIGSGIQPQSRAFLSLLGPISVQRDNILLGQAQVQIPLQAQRQAQRSAFGSIPNFPGFSPGFPGDFNLKFPGINLKFGFDESYSGPRNFGVFGNRRYTPSFDALILGIRGAAPKSAATLALGTRPITRGFSFINIKIPRFIR